jgi:alpha-D-ribose 1-methylphosphonate 5-triphosphate synthase subunit PhnI
LRLIGRKGPIKPSKGHWEKGTLGVLIATSDHHNTDTAPIKPRSDDTNNYAQSEDENFAPRVIDLLNREGLIEAHQATQNDPRPFDLTRQPVRFPADRSTRLQNLARGDEGFLLAMAYSTQRGYANSHPFVGEIRLGSVEIELIPEELGFAISIGDIEITECQMINQFAGSKTEPPQFTRGYGLAFGHSERKAMAMSLVDRALRATELGELVQSPAQMPVITLAANSSLRFIYFPHVIA